jgi:hypothetical protein
VDAVVRRSTRRRTYCLPASDIAGRLGYQGTGVPRFGKGATSPHGRRHLFIRRGATDGSAFRDIRHNHRRGRYASTIRTSSPPLVATA